MSQNDIFKDQLRSAFSDFEAPVPQDGWERIEQELNAVARTRIIRRNWYIGSVAAVAAILLGSLFFLKAPETMEQDRSALVEVSVPEKAESIEKQDASQHERTPAKGKGGKVEKRQLPSGRVGTLFAKRAESGEHETSTSKKIAEQNPEKAAVAEKEDETGVVLEKDLARQGEKREHPDREEMDRLIREFADAGDADIFNDPGSKGKKGSPVMLALNGKGGLTSSRKTVNSPMTLRSAGANFSKDFNSDAYLGNSGKNNLSAGYENMAPVNTRNIVDNVAEMEHAQPVSVSITVSKSIIDRISVETGLVYTYLFSRAKNTNIDFQNQETQHFHYLGIPVNFNYNFLNIGRLGLFTSLGGMVEKDIYGEFRSSGQSVASELNSASRSVTTTKISQKNPQFSVNAGIGLSYPVYKGLNLYGKIGGSYYFDARNYEYKTIYSDKKIILDLNAGIRFDF